MKVRAELMENLQKLKVLLNLDTDAYDAKLQLVWDTLERQTMIAIGRVQEKAIPQGLEAVILQMAVDYLGHNPMGIESIQSHNVKSIARGDTEITYNLADIAAVGSFIHLYDDLLWAFRRVVMR